MAVEMSGFAQAIMDRTYAHDVDDRKETWEEIAHRVTKNVMRAVGLNMRQKLPQEICRLITARKFMPGGRYLYAAGNQFHMTNNCLMLSVHDSREGWSELLSKCSMALMTGAGIGVDYSAIRHEGSLIRKTGGTATGPLSLMQIVNECGRGVMQGGNRRCLPASAPVTMADGSKKRVDKIRVGDLVLTQFGPREVTNVFQQGRQELVKIVTSRGSVTSSKAHRWLGASKDRCPKWLTAGSVEPGWKLYFHSHPTPGGSKIDTDWAYTLGYYLGNGCAYSSGRTHEVTFQLPEAHITASQVKTILSAMESKFSVSGTVRQGHGKCKEIRFRSKQLVGVFQKWRKPNSSFTLPAEILDADCDGRSAFLAGWFDADGSLHGGTTVRLANKYTSVLLEVKSLLCTLGLVSTVYPPGRTCVEMRLSAYQANVFNGTIGRFSHKYSLESRPTSRVPTRILSVEDAGVAETYDVEVEGVHEFVAYDHISHNSALLASINWSHPDVHKFIRIKNWPDEVKALKAADFSFPAMLDMTNLSVGLDDEFFAAYHDDERPKHALAHSVYWAVIEQMLTTGDPGLTVNVGKNKRETLRNACSELCSADTDDICNLGSINLSAVKDLDEFKHIVDCATAFLLAGTVYSDVPYSDVDRVRSKNRRLGLGLMGVHEWLLSRGKTYAPDEELGTWLAAYAKSGRVANKWADEWQLSHPKGTRAIAPNGTTGIVAETTGGGDPLFCVAYRRRYLKGDQYYYQYVVDPCAKRLIDSGIEPGKIEDAYTLARDVEKRVAFQAWLQGYVDHCISSTVNLPAWGTELNNRDTLRPFGSMLMRYLPQLRGITCYPDGGRMGQPLTPVPYEEAVAHEGAELVEEAANVCEITKGGSCGD